MAFPAQRRTALLPDRTQSRTVSPTHRCSGSFGHAPACVFGHRRATIVPVHAGCGLIARPVRRPPLRRKCGRLLTPFAGCTFHITKKRGSIFPKSTPMGSFRAKMRFQCSCQKLARQSSSDTNGLPNMADTAALLGTDKSNLSLNRCLSWPKREPSSSDCRNYGRSSSECLSLSVVPWFDHLWLSAPCGAALVPTKPFSPSRTFSESMACLLITVWAASAS